jgi:hypothetical protein
MTNRLLQILSAISFGGTYRCAIRANALSLQEAVIEKCSHSAGAALEPAVVLSIRASEVNNFWKSSANGQKGN